MGRMPGTGRAGLGGLGSPTQERKRFEDEAAHLAHFIKCLPVKMFPSKGRLKRLA